MSQWLNDAATKSPQHDSLFKQPQTAGDQILSGPMQAVISSQASIHDTSYSFAGQGVKCRQAQANVLRSLSKDLWRTEHAREDTLLWLAFVVIFHSLSYLFMLVLFIAV